MKEKKSTWSPQLRQKKNLTEFDQNRHGQLLLPLLFNMVLEALATAIKQETIYIYIYFYYIENPKDYTHINKNTNVGTNKLSLLLSLLGSIKDRNGMDLTEAEDIKKRWQEYTEELYKKELHNPDNHNGVITHLEPDILECEVKWALGSISTNKASGGDGIPVELFQILKDDAVKVLHSIC